MTTDQFIGSDELLSPSSAAAIIANADALLDLVAAEADEADEAGRMTERLGRAFRAAGLFEMGFPRRRGGLEMTLADQVRVVAKIARVDASAAWNVGVLNATGYYAGRLGEDAYAELYPVRDMPTSGSFHPRGRADVVEGGYLVSGRWDWGSGSYAAEHVIGGAMVFDGGEPVIGPNGKQLLLGLWLPRDAIEPADNWQTLGVRGSGSTSYSITEPAFVPAGHSFDREALPNPEADPLNKHVTLVFFGLTGVCMGLAQHLVDLTLAAARQKPSVDAVTKRALGQIATEVDMMYAGILEIAKRTDEVIFTPGAVLTAPQELRLACVNTMAAEALRRIADVCLEHYGSRYIYDADPMERVVRDIQGALAHAGAKRMHWGFLGGALLDDPETAPTVVDEQWAQTSP